MYIVHVVQNMFYYEWDNKMMEYTPDFYALGLGVDTNQQKKGVRYDCFLDFFKFILCSEYVASAQNTTLLSISCQLQSAV